MKLKNIFDKKFFSICKILLLFTFLFVLLFCLCLFVFKNYRIKKTFEKSLADFQKLNEKTVFSIDKIYLYSSAYAENSSGKQPIWNLNVHQYTDIAIYLNNHIDGTATYENTLKNLTISNIKFKNLNISGTPNLFYKNIYNFGKYEKIDANLINEGLSYTIVSDVISYDNPQIYSNGSNPITLSYLNHNIKNNCAIEDSSITFNGSLLKKCSIPLSDISNSISFTISLTNNLDQVFTTTVFIDIPLSNETSSIYEGSITSVLENENMFRFYRHFI